MWLLAARATAHPAGVPAALAALSSRGLVSQTSPHPAGALTVGVASRGVLAQAAYACSHTDLSSTNHHNHHHTSQPTHTHPPSPTSTSPSTTKPFPHVRQPSFFACAIASANGIGSPATLIASANYVGGSAATLPRPRWLSTSRPGLSSAATTEGVAPADAPATTAAAGAQGSSSSSSSGSSLHVTVEPLAGEYEGVSVVTLTRPQARNAIGRQLLRELAEAVDLLRQERTTRCVVIRSAVPGVFSAGADLKERAGMTQAETIEFVTTLRRTMGDVQALPMPTIAAIDGFALGGGAEMALAADIRVAGAGAVFAFPEAQLGIIPGAGGTQRLPRLVGASRAKELIFTARRVKAEEALALGLVDYVVGENRGYARALEIAAEVAKSAPLSLRMAKAAINHGMDVDLGTGLRMEEAYYAQLVPTKDRLEGLKAFAEKRRPEYKGE